MTEPGQVPEANQGSDELDDLSPEENAATELKGGGSAPAGGGHGGSREIPFGKPRAHSTRLAIAANVRR
ncbi:hypothetical protein FZI97_10825 [Mycobacterium sp. CBMA360]|uniref:hypothetical protein n=1 Tax=Mycolicibacterium sp. CBMA 360 TaxID=2606614 RepID=UPI0012DBE47D|nr:hypothetical protein [Mycolicibacterium sp. CBMA 360]MUL46403.1 hypothetical protein [Mycolicibacterium sp. CBMA 360]